MSQKIYQPVIFVHSYTIGKSKQEKKQYIWQYKEIIIPKPGYQPVYYYLFHVPPIYNWLKNIPSKEQYILNNYINQTNIILPNNQPQNQNQINFNQQSFISALQKFIFQWQIVKICCCCKVYIQSMEQKSFSTLAKTHQWVNYYEYDKQKSILTCNSVVISNKHHKGNFIIQQYPFAPMLHRFQGLKITIMKQQYDLCLVYQENCIYIRAGNKIWYCIFNQNQVRIVGTNQLHFKNGIIFIYVKVIKHENILKMASMEVKNNQTKSTLNQAQIKEKNKPNLVHKQEKPQKISKITVNKNSIQQQEGQLAPLIKNTQQIIPINGQTDTFIKYSQTIQNLFDRPKQRDEYDRDYDKGKVKKIRKKINYIKPNYNEVYKQVLIANQTRANQHNVEQNETQRYNKLKRGNKFPKTKNTKKDVRDSFKNKYQRQT